MNDEDAPTAQELGQQTPSTSNNPGWFQRERVFLMLIATGFLLVGVTYKQAAIARWIGFMLAGYSAIANDSIQTIGTFIASNRKQKWWILWLFIGGIFVATMAYSFVTYHGDVTYQRLSSKGFEKTPEAFSYLQVAAPLCLLVLTRLKMPVSTTFLLLSGFAAKAANIQKVVLKSVSGYVLAFVIAIVVWLASASFLEKTIKKGEPHPIWRPLQWVTSGLLWAVWLMQDASNIAVYLPRHMGTLEFVVFTGFIFGGLGVLFYKGGDRIQEIVTEKSRVEDVRAATLIDFVYTLILYYFKIHSKVPMSTTWVFLGLLAGRELAIAIRKSGDRSVGSALKLMGRDLAYASIGLIVSLLIALGVNDAFRRQVFGG